MKPVSSVIGLSCIVAMGTACSRELQVHRLQESNRVGIAYVLPFTQYQIAEAWTLDYCPDAKNPDPLRGDEPRISLKVDATLSAADDGDLAFVVNPQDLQTLTNITAFTAKWQDGRNMLASINASSEDRTAQIIGNLTKTAVKILPLAMGAPFTTAATRRVIECDPTINKALNAAKKAKNVLDAANDLVGSRTEEVNRIAAKLQQQGINADDGTKKSLGDAIDVLVQAQSDQAEAADALARAIKPLSFTRKFRWPEDGNTFSRGPDVLPDSIKIRWLGANAGRVDPQALYLQIERAGSFGRVPGDGSYARPDSRIAGLRYRMPAAGRLVACSSSPCTAANSDSVIASFDGQILQLGYVNVLPFRSRTFGNNSFSAEFADNGSLKSVGYDQKAAPLETATGALADSAGQLSDVLNPTARLNAKTGYLKALKEQRDALEALQADPNTAAATETASLGADTALLNARIAKLNAEIALADLQAKQGAGK